MTPAPPRLSLCRSWPSNSVSFSADTGWAMLMIGAMLDSVRTSSISSRCTTPLATPALSTRAAASAAGPFGESVRSAPGAE